MLREQRGAELGEWCATCMSSIIILPTVFVVAHHDRRPGGNNQQREQGCITMQPAKGALLTVALFDLLLQCGGVGKSESVAADDAGAVLPCKLSCALNDRLACQTAVTVVTHKEPERGLT